LHSKITNIDLEKMSIVKEDFERLRQLKAIQAANCRKTKPWQKSTGPKTPQGKKSKPKFTTSG
jgi:hypothetical protein